MSTNKLFFIFLQKKCMAEHNIPPFLRYISK